MDLRGRPAAWPVSLRRHHRRIASAAAAANCSLALRANASDAMIVALTLLSRAIAATNNDGSIQSPPSLQLVTSLLLYPTVIVVLVVVIVTIAYDAAVRCCCQFLHLCLYYGTETTARESQSFGDSRIACRVRYGRDATT